MSWISVKDKLPRKLEKVLFHWVLKDSNGYPCVMNISMGYLCEAGWDIYLPYHSYPLRPDVCAVTHWMELPDYPVEPPPDRFVGAVIIDDPLCPTIEDSVAVANVRVKEFAKKFCEENKDLLKRLADR